MRAPENASDLAMQQIGLALRGSMEQFALQVVWAIEKAAARFAVDSSYVRFVFERPTSGWPRLAHEDLRMLSMAAVLVDSFGTPDEREVELLGDGQDHQVDMALVWVARWCRTVLAPEMKRAYVASLALDPGADTGGDALQRLEHFERWLHGPTQLGKQRSLASIVDTLFA